MHVLDVTTRDDGTLVLDLESDAALAGCTACGVVAVGQGRRVQVLHEAPAWVVRCGCGAQADLALTRTNMRPLDLDRGAVPSASPA